jgi:hypothetical protein
MLSKSDLILINLILFFKIILIYFLKALKINVFDERKRTFQENSSLLIPKKKVGIRNPYLKDKRIFDWILNSSVIEQ